MSNPRPADINWQDTNAVHERAATRSYSQTNYQEVLRDLNIYGGGLAIEGTHYANPGARSTDVVSAAVVATAGSNPSYLTAPGMATAGTPQYLTAGTTTGGVNYRNVNMGMQTTGDPADLMAMAQEQLAMSQTSSLAMLMIQDQMGAITKYHTTLSNVMNSRDMMHSAIIRNTKIQ